MSQQPTKKIPLPIQDLFRSISANRQQQLLQNKAWDLAHPKVVKDREKARAKYEKQQQLIQNPNKQSKAAKATASMFKELKQLAPAATAIAIAAPAINSFLGGLTTPFQDVGEEVEDLGLTVSEGFQGMADDMIDDLNALTPVAEQWGTDIGQMYTDIKNKDWAAVTEDVTTGLDAVKGSILDVFGNEDMMTSAGELVGALINGVTTSIANITTEEWSAVFTGLGTAVMTAIGSIDWWDLILASTFLDDFALAGLNIYKFLVDSVINLFDGDKK